MNEITITPELARKIIAAYEAFDGGTRQVVNQLSWENFKKLLSLIGQELNTRSIEETVSLLRRLASEREEILTAQLPPNLAEMVKNYEKWEELRREAEKNPAIIPSLQVQAALLTRGLEQQETILPSEKEDLESWKKQKKDIKIQRLLKGPLTSLQIREVVQQVGVPVYTPIPTGTFKPVKGPPSVETSKTSKEEPKKEPVSEIQKLILLYGPRRRSFVGGVFRGLRSVVTGVEDENLRPLVEVGIGKAELEKAISQLQKEFPGGIPSDNIYLLYLRDVLERLPQVQKPAQNVRLEPIENLDTVKRERFFLIQTNPDGNLSVRPVFKPVVDYPTSIRPRVPAEPFRNVSSYSQIKLGRFFKRLHIPTFGLGGIFGAGAAPMSQRGGLVPKGGAQGSSFLGFNFGFGTEAAAARLTLLTIAGALMTTVFAVFFFSFVSTNSYQSAFLEEAEGLVRPGVSPYIDLKKTVSPGDQFENDQLPDKLEYTITVSAKEKVLTNVSITDETRADGEKIKRILDTQSWSVPEIGVGQTHTQRFSLNLTPQLKSELENSFIINTVTVKATVEDEVETQISSASLTIRVGNPPEDCPSGWPTEHGFITQGPYGSFSHSGQEAVDIVNPSGNSPPTPIYATHKGTAFRFELTGKYRGNHVQVVGACEGKTFNSYWLHFSSRNVVDGQEVQRGNLLGNMGCTGSCTGPHLHYEFKGIKMDIPYIPAKPSVGLQW